MKIFAFLTPALKRVVSQKAGNSNIATNIYGSKIWVDVPQTHQAEPLLAYGCLGCLFGLPKRHGFESPGPRSGRRLSRMEQNWVNRVPMLPGLLVAPTNCRVLLLCIPKLTVFILGPLHPSPACFSMNLS